MKKTEFANLIQELAAEVLAEGIHDPMNPGILKKRLGKLSCTKVRAARSKDQTN